MLFARITHQAGYVDLRTGLGNVGEGRIITGLAVGRGRCPARVDEHVGEAGSRGEVDVVLHGGRVHAGRKVGAGRGISAPPVPGRLAGFDPRGVADLRGRVEIENDVRLDEAAGL